MSADLLPRIYPVKMISIRLREKIIACLLAICQSRDHIIAK